MTDAAPVDATPWAALAVFLGAAGLQVLGMAERSEAPAAADVRSLLVLLVLPSVLAGAAMAWGGAVALRRWGANPGVAVFTAVGAGGGVALAVMMTMALLIAWGADG